MDFSEETPFPKVPNPTVLCDRSWDQKEQIRVHLAVGVPLNAEEVGVLQALIALAFLRQATAHMAMLDKSPQIRQEQTWEV